MTSDRLEAEWVRGVLPLLALTALSHGDAHGYAIAQRLVAAGFGPLKGGTLYPVLNRLEADGSIEAEWVAGDGGPGRKSFRLTAAGRDRLEALNDHWAAHVGRVAGLRDGEGRTPA